MPGFTLSRRQALVAVACVLAAVLGAARLFSASNSPPPKTVQPPLVAEAPAPPTRTVMVDVEGAVRRPGVYRLATGARVVDAIARAGGATARADKSLVNLAAPVSDGQQVLVPKGGGGGAVTAPGASAAASAAPLDLNTATLEQLDALPGIGPVTAQKILDYRREHGPFTSVDQLDAIAGIGPTRIDNLRGHVLP